MSQHKWHDVVVAIINGEEVERNWNNEGWELYDPLKHISPIDWMNDDRLEWRIKPQPKEPQYLYIYWNDVENYSAYAIEQDTYLFKDEFKWKCVGKIKLEVED